MAVLVECVPNFSEGRSKEIIEAIASAIGNTDGCTLLDVDPGHSTNRTVYTFVGSPEAVVDGALSAARVAFHLIDMTKHSGEHPRMGALDVCPFIPVQNATMQDCIECARKFAHKLAIEFSVPVYLYGEAALSEKRTVLSNIRSGEYEGLSKKLSDPDWIPDFGGTHFIPTWGATAVGARKFLIAYNINVLGTKEQAHRIALDLRETGRGDNKPGLLKNVQAIGWYLEDANIAQISMNITDFDETPLYLAYEKATEIAASLKISVIGSQIVGVVPLQAMLKSARYYMEKDDLFILEEDQQLRLAVSKLGLNSLGAFSPKEKIIEYMIQDEVDGPLISMDVKEFVIAVGSRTPAPGGGSVAALVAALGAALGSMVAFLTYGNRKFEDLDSEIRRLLPPLHKATRELLPFIDADTMAFTEYMEAMKLSKNNEEEVLQREAAMQHGLHSAINIPMTVARVITSLWDPLTKLASFSNINCQSDFQVSVKCLETAVFGAYCNVETNLVNMKDEKFRSETKETIKDMWTTAQARSRDILDILNKRSDSV